MSRERRDYILISIALIIAALTMYLQQEDGWMVGLTMAIAATATFGTYCVARWYKKKH